MGLSAIMFGLEITPTGEIYQSHRRQVAGFSWIVPKRYVGASFSDRYGVWIRRRLVDFRVDELLRGNERER